MGSDVAAKDDSQKKSDVIDVDTDNKDVAGQSKNVAMPVETRLDDTIDEVNRYLYTLG